MARRKQADDLALCTVTDQGVRFETGKQVTFRYKRNTTKAPRYGARFGQDIEPAGRYLTIAQKGAAAVPGLETGSITFRNPLVLRLKRNSDDETYGPEGWKARLQRAYGKKRRALSCELQRQGYDGIVTCDAYKDAEYTAEIVDLRVVTCTPIKRRKL